MNIAVLFYGRLTNAEEHFNNIRESIGKNNNIDFYLSSDNSPQNLLEEFINIYNPIAFSNDPIGVNVCNCEDPFNCIKYIPTFEKAPETNIHNMEKHWINKQRVWKLFQENKNINYDVILSLRIDLVFQDGFNFEEMEENTIYIPNNFDYRGINDQVAYGTIKSMEKYMNIDENFCLMLNKGVMINPEVMLQEHISIEKLEVKRFNLRYYISGYTPIQYI